MLFMEIITLMASVTHCKLLIIAYRHYGVTHLQLFYLI